MSGTVSPTIAQPHRTALFERSAGRPPTAPRTSGCRSRRRAISGPRRPVLLHRPGQARHLGAPDAQLLRHRRRTRAGADSASPGPRPPGASLPSRAVEPPAVLPPAGASASRRPEPAGNSPGRTPRPAPAAAPMPRTGPTVSRPGIESPAAFSDNALPSANGVTRHCMRQALPAPGSSMPLRRAASAACSACRAQRWSTAWRGASPPERESRSAPGIVNPVRRTS